MVTSIEYVERKVLRKVKNKEDLGEESAGRKEKQIGEKIS